jgi:hypothetical protein
MVLLCCVLAAVTDAARQTEEASSFRVGWPAAEVALADVGADIDALAAVSTDGVKHSHTNTKSLDCAVLTDGKKAGKTCQCYSFAEKMLALCRRRADTLGEMPWDNCEHAFLDMWQTKTRLGDLKLAWIAMAFLSQVSGLVLAWRGTYWTGFSIALGTREVMDEYIALAMRGCNKSAPCFDLEHEGSWIGQLMRSGGWFRPCHRAHHDSALWQHMSEAFSYKQQQALNRLERLAKSYKEMAQQLPYKYVADLSRQLEVARRVNILINRYLDKFRASFLVVHELPILWCATVAPNLFVYDFKNGCRQEVMAILRGEEAGFSSKCPNGSPFKKPNRIVCRDPAHDINLDMTDASKMVARGLAKDIEELEGRDAHGWRFEAVDKGVANLSEFHAASFAGCQAGCNSFPHCTHFTWWENATIGHNCIIQGRTAFKPVREAGVRSGRKED